VRRRLLSCSAAAALLVAGMPAMGTAQPTAGGWTSENVEYVRFVPFEAGTATTGRIVGDYFYVTSWRSISIYDISDPEDPSLQSMIPLEPNPAAGSPGFFRFQNEDLSTNGNVLLFSEQLPRNDLHVYDVEDKSNPTLLATVVNGGGHTSECLLNCRWSYSSTGRIVDLRDPAEPVLRDENWLELAGVEGGMHAMHEFRRGLIVTSPHTGPMQIIDVRNPLRPRTIASGEHPDPSSFILHNSRFPRGGRDRFLMQSGERNFQPRCQENQGPFMTFDARGWRGGRAIRHIDTYTVENGTYQDGGPPANGLGCSAHWFEAHPKFRNGGLVTIGYYEHGVRILDVNRRGMIEEVGWFVPWGGSTGASYWASDEIVYSIDYQRGFDILRFNDEAADY
jgi:hypothetical protein